MGSSEKEQLMKFPAELGQLGPMLRYVKQAAHAAGFNDEEVHRIELASEEAIVNIIKHAYQEEPGRTIDIDYLNRGPCHMSVILTDDGSPFNPLEADIDLDLDAPLEERPIGGLGIFLFRQLMDEVQYTRQANTNVLTLTKRPGHAST